MTESPKLPNSKRQIKCSLFVHLHTTIDDVVKLLHTKLKGIT